MSKYSKSPCPDKETLEKLYNQGLTQREIGKQYDVCYQTVVAWMKKLGIKSRGFTHIVKFNTENPNWKGDKAGYASLHYRVSKLKGKPKVCEVCGTDKPDKFYEWACVGDYRNMDDYKRMCRSCHRKHDKSYLSLTNKRNEFDRGRM